MASYDSDALAVRAVELEDVVDLRVVVQGTETFRGGAMPEVALPETRTPTVLRRMDFETDDPWGREHSLRQFSIDRGRDEDPEALLLLADADEIPHPQALTRAATRGSKATLPVDYREWWMNWRAPDNWQPPHQPLLGRWEDYHVAGGAQAARAGCRWPRVGPRGWHLSTLGDSAMASIKLSSFAHSEYDNEDHNQVEILSERRRTMNDILARFWLERTTDLPGCADRFPHLLEPGGSNAS